MADYVEEAMGGNRSIDAQLEGTKTFGGRRARRRRRRRRRRRTMRRTMRTKTKDLGPGEVEHVEVGTVEELWLVGALPPEVGGLELEKEIVRKMTERNCCLGHDNAGQVEMVVLVGGKMVAG
jgi:hypothetical protein